MVCIISCASDYKPKLPTFQFKYGVIPTSVSIPKKDISPTEQAESQLVHDGVSRIRIGLGICLAAFAVSLMFANPITARISNYFLVGGGILAGDGFLLVFMAEYLIWFCLLFLGMFGVLLWARKKSILTLFAKAKKPKVRALDWMRFKPKKKL